MQHILPYNLGFMYVYSIFTGVDLIKPVSRPSVRTSVRPQKVFPIGMKFCVWVEVDE